MSVVDEEDNGANAEAESETAEAAASADSNLSLKTLKCKRCGCLQQFEVAAAAVEDADSDENSQVSDFLGDFWPSLNLALQQKLDSLVVFEHISGSNFSAQNE